MDLYENLFGQKATGQKLQFITHQGRVIPIGGPGGGGGSSGASDGSAVSVNDILSNELVQKNFVERFGDGADFTAKIDQPTSWGTYTSISGRQPDGFSMTVQVAKKNDGTYFSRLFGTPSGPRPYGSESTWGQSKNTTSIQDALNGAFESYFSWHSRP